MNYEQAGRLIRAIEGDDTMNTRDDGGPVYPKGYAEAEYTMGDYGLSYLDYAAIKAMQALVSSGNTNPKEVAEAAYVCADAMLAEKRRREGETT